MSPGSWDPRTTEQAATMCLGLPPLPPSYSHCCPETHVHGQCVRVGGHPLAKHLPCSVNRRTEDRPCCQWATPGYLHHSRATPGAHVTAGRPLGAHVIAGPPPSAHITAGPPPGAHVIAGPPPVLMSQQGHPQCSRHGRTKCWGYRSSLALTSTPKSPRAWGIESHRGPPRP